MILKFSVENFLSFKDEVILDFEATNSKDLEDSHVIQVSSGVRILKLGVIYGANASGKTNLIKALSFIHNFLFTIRNKDQTTTIVPFLLNNDSKNASTKFRLEFFVEGKKYIYLLELNEYRVISESLSYYPTIKPFLIFSRKIVNEISKIKFNAKLRVGKTIIKEMDVKCLNNMSVFAAYNQVNIQIPIFDDVIGWMKNQFMPSITPLHNLSAYIHKKISKDDISKNYIVEFLKKADFNIDDFILQVDKVPIQENLVDMISKTSDMSEEEKERVKKEKTIEFRRILFKHKILNQDGEEKFFVLPEDLQSPGTMRTMGLACAINQALQRNAFLAIDEVESSLHPRLVEFVIETFLKQSRQSQLIFTTHYDGLLEEEDLFRKDNIFFTNKKKDGSTELYSLADFKGLSRISSLKKAYKYGKFDAVPNI